MSRVIAIDFETFFSSKLKYSVKTMIAEQYCRHSLFDAYCVSVCDGKNAWSGQIDEFNWAALEGATLLSHNAYFDQSVYAELVRRGKVPQGNFVAWHCTANMTSYLCNRRSLADACAHLLKVKLDKDPRENANGKHWPNDFSADERTAMLAYAREDARRCWELFDKFGHLWPERERKISDLTIQRGREGVQIDVALLNNYIMQTHDMKLATEKLIPWLDDSWDDEDEFDAKPTSTKCIAEQARRTGIPVPPVKSHDEDAYEEWHENYHKDHPWVSALGSWRSINKLLKTFMVIKERLRDDGTMPFGQKYCGAHTGRISGESRVNLFNQRKMAVLCRQDGLMEEDDYVTAQAHKERKKTGQWPAWVKYAIDFRNLIIPRPGHIMITSDLSQIEPRTLAWLAKDVEFLALVAKGYSPYQAHAMTTMGWTGGTLKDEDPKKYDLAKARLLSLGYGAGWEKLIVMASKSGLDLTKDDPEWIETEDPLTHKISRVSGYGSNSRKVVKEYRESNPRIAGENGLWRKLEDALRRSVGSDLVLTLPNGRRMVYESIRAEVRIEPDKETGKPRRRTVFTACIGGKRKITYGSKLVENVVQAIAREIFMERCLAMEEAGVRILFAPYDEAVCEVKVDSGIECSHIKRLMCQCPAWIEGLPLDTDTKVVACYQK